MRGSEEDSYLRLIDVVYLSTLCSRIKMKENKKIERRVREREREGFEIAPMLSASV